MLIHQLPPKPTTSEFAHHSEDCTFETMLKQFGLAENKGLREHDIDLKDGKFHRLEASGLNAIIDGLGNLLRDDRKQLQQTNIVFDGLYALLSKESGKDGQAKMHSGRRCGKK